MPWTIPSYSRTPSRFVVAPTNQYQSDRSITKTCRIIYRVEGDGTKHFAELTAGDSLDVLGPLGNGFDLSGLTKEDEVFIVGGGIGVPPFIRTIETAKATRRQSDSLFRLWLHKK